MRRFVLSIFATLPVIIGVAACSPDAADFKSEAEDFIEEEDGDLQAQIGVTFSDASCEEPASTDEGSTFACTATASDGQPWDFRAEITGENEFSVSGAPGAASGDSVPATGGSAATTPPAGTTAPPGSTPTS